jgi:hypothetical protein
MYCPNCGALTAAEQNFCRSCGANLRAFSETYPGPSPTQFAFRPRWQLIVESVTDALRTGFEYAFQRSTASLREESQASWFHRWGLIAFWVGLAALIGDFMGFLLIVAGIGLMAYARGFFGPVRETPSARTSEFQAPPFRETTYSPTTPPSVTNPDTSDYVPPRSEANRDVQ